MLISKITVHHIRQRYLQHIKSSSAAFQQSDDSRHFNTIFTNNASIWRDIFTAAANHDDGGSDECRIR